MDPPQAQGVHLEAAEENKSEVQKSDEAWDE
jgi:hypothetical protein